MASVLIDARLGWGSGIGRYVANTAPKVASRLAGDQFELLVKPVDIERARRAAAGVSNLSVASADITPFSIDEQVRLPGRLRQYDLTWFTNYWVPLRLRSNFMVTVHDLIHLEPALLDAGRARRAIARRTFAHVASRARAVLYVSRFTAREFERRFGAPRHGRVAGCGIDHSNWRLFDPNQPPPKKRQILLVGAAKKHKNFGAAVESFRAATLSRDWRLTIVTPDDPLRSSIDLADMASDGRINVVKGIDNDALRALYADAAIVLMPSRYEGFGLPLAEGLQAGAQCISSTAPSLVELGLGANVTWVDASDREGWTIAITSACRRHEDGCVDRAAIAANMRHALTFTWDKVAEATAEMIDVSLRRGLTRPH